MLVFMVDLPIFFDSLLITISTRNVWNRNLHCGAIMITVCWDVNRCSSISTKLHDVTWNITVIVLCITFVWFAQGRSLSLRAPWAYTAVWRRLYTFTDTSSTPLSLSPRFLSVAPQFPLESPRKSPEGMSTRDFSASPTAHPEIGIPRRILSVRKKRTVSTSKSSSL